MINRHFITGNFQSRAGWLSNEDCSKVQDNIVITCVDCAIINKIGQMLLGKRTHEPWPDWWIFGGRMMPGESFEIAAARNLRRELDLVIDPLRFCYLGTYSFVWAKRQIPPQENGCHNVSIVMALIITDNEIDKIKINDKYTLMLWMPIENVIGNPDFHPAIQTIAKDLHHLCYAPSFKINR